MLSVRWRKVLRDLWGNKTRTLLVILSIAVGVFAIGAVYGSYLIISKDMTEGYRAVAPANATLYVENFNDDLVQTVASMRDIKEASGTKSLDCRIQTGKNEWKKIRLIAISDYKDIKINKVSPEEGAWPPGRKELLLERGSIKFLNAKIGQPLTIETADGKKRNLSIAGTCHDLNQAPSMFTNQAYAYVTFDTMSALGESKDYDQLNITLKDDSQGVPQIQKVAELVRNKVENSGRQVYWIQVFKPGEHPVQPMIQGILLLMGVMGVFSLILSGFLVINTINAIISQQIKQIGIMKAIGARRLQIIGMYMVLVLIFGLLSLMVALPLGALVAHGISKFFAGLINFNIVSNSIPAKVFIVEVIISLLVPILAAIAPVYTGTAITVREALSSMGISNGKTKRGLISRIFEKISILSRPIMLSIRNTFRRKGRLTLTLITLTLGGAIFITVFSVKDSLILTTDAALKYFNYDVGVSFKQSYRIEKVIREAERVPGVTKAECWGYAGTRVVRVDRTESEQFMLYAPPADTTLLQPTVIKGRWLRPDDGQAIVVNTEVVRKEPNLKIGDSITLKIKGKKYQWQIVGIVKGVLTGPMIYANYPYFTHLTNEVGKTSVVQLVTEQHDGEFQTQVAKNVEEYFKQSGLKVTSADTIESIRQSVNSQFIIIAMLLLVMALLIAFVGGLGLMGTMSINVLERTREIGVMRAIGASDGAILQIVMIEGLLIGVISWILGFVISMPLSRFLSDQLGNTIMQSPLNYVFSMKGAVIWLVVVMILAAAASFLPAWNASRVSVKEVLAYE
jgi:putative ABC transport system permease protein